MLRKITRIFFKTFGAILLLLIFIGIGLYFGVRSYTFQTWLGKKASTYLSSELGNTISIKAIQLDFFSKAHVKGIIVLDKHLDTILHGDALLNIKRFDYKHQSLMLEKITLKDVTAKLIMYKKDTVFNYEFLVDYFDSGKKDTTVKKQGWDVKLGDVFLDNVAFVYRKEKFVTPVNANINFDDIWLQHTSGKISNFKLNGDTIHATVANLTTKEQSGFVLNNLTTKASISESRLLCENIYIKTPKTFIKGKIDFLYSSWDDYSDFIEKVKMNSCLEDSTYVSFKDIASFTSELNGLNETVFLSGDVKGYVNDLILQNFKLAYGKHTKFNGNITLSGLPDINTSYLHVDAKEIATNYTDLIKLPNYPFNENKPIDLPTELKRLGTLSYKGKFDGFISDFTTYGTFNSGLGSIATELSIKLGNKQDDIIYHGKVKTNLFDLGTLIGQNNLNNLSLNCEIKGQGISLKNLKANFEGQVLNINYNGYNYKDIKLDGKIDNKLFEGLLVSKDPNADLDFNGTVDFKNKFPQMNFISTINNLKLSALNLVNDKDSGNISTQLFININGDNSDNMSGQINFDNTIYNTKTKTFKLSSFNVDMDQQSAEKEIKLTTGYLNAGIKGKYQLSNLKPAIESLLSHYYPTFFKKPASNKKNTPVIKYNDELAFKLRIKKFNTINELFLPDLMLSPESTLEGNLNTSNNQLNVQASSSKFTYKFLNVKNLNFYLKEKEDTTVLANLSGKSLNIEDSTVIENFNFDLNSADKNSSYLFNWNNFKTPNNKGEVSGNFKISPTSFLLACNNISATIRDSTWRLTSPNSVAINEDGRILINPIELVNNQQKIILFGILSEKISDSLVIQTKNVALEQFNSLLSLVKLKLNGSLNGNIVLSNKNKNLVFDADLNLNSLKLNENFIGELAVNTVYNSAAKSVFLSGYTSLGLQDEFGNQIKNISFNGNYYLDKRAESIDINLEAKPANLKLLNPFLVDILTIKNAFVNGEGRVHGSPDNIKIDGKFKLFNSEIKVDYTNVTYNITGEIEVFPDQIRFSDLLMREKGKKAAPQGVVNGNIFHTNFSKIQLDYDITYKNMLLLNTTQKENSTFYGKVYGTGNVGIYGFTNNLFMKIIDTTTRNSKFYLPLDGPAEVNESDFIHFVKKDTLSIKKTTSLTGFNLEMLLNVTPDAQAQIIVDNKTGDALNVQGQGDLNLKVNTLGKFEMFGDYIITNGDYLFTLENVINKKFDIDAGSSISWSGNPLNAEIDITTSYKQRASVAPLLNDTTGQYKGRFPVDCKLKITDKLFSPNINFAIDFPNIDATAKARINNVLSDEAELNRQVFSFLLFRSFVTPQIYNSNAGGVSASGAGNAAASTGSELLSNRVSEFLNTYFGNLTGIRDLQLGLNYRPANQNNNEAVDLALSKQFFNNKITVDGNFGVNNNQVKNSSNIIGDVNVDYKLSEDGKYRLKAFNRSNDNTQIATAGGPFTQGVGIFYREEFETFNQLFARYLQKLKKKEQTKK